MFVDGNTFRAEFEEGHGVESTGATGASGSRIETITKQGKTGPSRAIWVRSRRSSIGQDGGVSSVNYLSRSATTRIPVAHPSSSTTSNNVINVRSGAAPEGVDD